MITRILTAIQNALASSARMLLALGDDILSLPWYLRQMLMGPSPIGPEVEDTYGAAPATSMGPEAQRRAMVERGLLPLDIEPGTDGRDPLGELVKQYAATASDKRSRISLEKLSPPQIAWLTSLPEADLEKLALANAVHCGRLARGRKVPVTGVDRFRDDREYVASAVPQPEPALLLRVKKLARKREDEKRRVWRSPPDADGFLTCM